MTAKLKRPSWWPLTAILGLVLVLGACSSGGSETSVTGDPEPVANSDASNFEAPSVDQTLAFTRPVQPFDTDVVAVVDGDRIDVVDIVASEVIASHPASLDPNIAQATASGGAIYVTDESQPGSRQLLRIDAGGMETVEFEAVGFLEHRLVSEGHALHIRGEESATFLAARADGQIDQYNFDSELFIESNGDVIVATAPDYNGDVWVLDSNMSVVDSANLGQVRNRPGLRAENVLRVSQGDEDLLVDLDTWEISPEASDFTRTDTGFSRQFSDGWVGELVGNEFTIIDPDGQSVLESPIDSISSFGLLAHPDNDTVLFSLSTCTNREGSICESDDESGSTDSESDEIYVPPGFVDVFLFDTATGELTPVAIEGQTSLAVLAIDSGWFVSSVAEGTTAIWSISSDGVAENLDQIEAGYGDFTINFFEPVVPNGLARMSRDADSLFLLTDDGLQTFAGTMLKNGQNWRSWEDLFAHI